MNEKVRRIGLSAVLMLMGGLLIAGAVLSMIPTGLIPLDQWIGVHASVAAAALGVGLCAAAWDPIGNVSWVRIAIIYSVLVVVYQFLALIVLGVPLSAGPLVYGIFSAVLLVVFYPFRSQLVPPRSEAAKKASWGATSGSSSEAGVRA
jgi:hypothetical protein